MTAPTRVLPPLTRRRFIACALAAPAIARSGDDSAAAAMRDAELLRQAYTALHPGLHRYNTPDQIAGHFDRLRADLARAGNRAQAYLALARVTGAVRCGHSYPNFYNQTAALRAELFTGRDRLPLHFRWMDGRMVVTRDLTPGSTLPAGTEILSIDEHPVASLLQALLPLARADGSNDAKRIRLMEVAGIDTWEAFDLYAPMLFPQWASAAKLTLRTRGPDGDERRISVPLMTAAERAAAAPSPIARARDAVLWSISRLPGGVCVLRMPSWALYNSSWDWRAWLNQALDDISVDGTRALVIDLRGNEGGLDCGDVILARLIDAELELPRIHRRVRYRRVPADLNPYLDTWDNSFRDWGDAALGPRADGLYDLTRYSDGPDSRAVIRPTGRRYKGRVLVLVDATNSSATFQFAQTVKDTGLGRLVGSTTGGNRRGINGGAFFFLRLPGCGIEVDVPLIGTFPVAAQPDAGVEPDVRVDDRIADIASGFDRRLETALQLARDG